MNMSSYRNRYSKRILASRYWEWWCLPLVERQSISRPPRAEYADEVLCTRVETSSYAVRSWSTRSCCAN